MSKLDQEEFRKLFNALQDMQGILEALRKVTALAERNVCPHEEIYRGGTIWTICWTCGAKWADDEGGKPKFEEPEEITRAREILSKYKP